MANLISRVWASMMRRKSRVSTRRRRRALGVEAMEQRRLLAGDLGTISGTVFTDETDDGFGAGTDAPLVGVTLNLYQDGGDGVFDAGTVDDTFLLSEVTDANGEYRFDQLGPGRFFVEQAPVSGQLQRPSETVKTVDISEADSTGVETLNIDTFDTSATTPDPLTATPGTTASDQTSTAPGETLGDERDVVINNDASSSNDIEVTSGSGVLFINSGGLTTGNVVLSYDGVDASATTIDHTTLGPIDLTANDGEAFYFQAGSEAGNTLTIDVFSGATDFSTFTVPMPVVAGANPTEDLLIRFDEFSIGGGAANAADFSNVTAISVRIDLASASDAAFDFVSIVSPFAVTENFANLNPMSIGDLVFGDIDDNGLFEAGETGLSDVSLELYQDDGTTAGSLDPSDTLVGTTSTDSSGIYLFDDLFPGDYIALIPESQFAASGDPLFGYNSSFAGGAYEPAPDPNTDIDNDDNGTLIAGVGVATGVITLASGTEPVDDGDQDPDSNLTIDFGFVPEIDLDISKTADSPSVLAGGQLTYNVTVTNNGPASADNVLVVDDLPDLAGDALTIVSAVSDSGNGTVTQTGNSAGEVEVSYPSLAAGATETITIVVAVPSTAAAAAAITNTVTAAGDGSESDSTNNEDSVDVAVDRAATLTLVKSDSPDPVSVGDSLTYTLEVSNTGPSSATDVIVNDPLPTGLSFDSATESTGTGTVTETSGTVEAQIPLLDTGETVTITINATVDSTFSGDTLSNTATASATEAQLVTTNEDTTVNPSVDLAITKSDSDDPVDRGGQLTYTLDIVNNGPSAATDVVVVDTLPEGVSYVSASGGTVTAPSGGNSDVTIELGSLPSGDTAQVTIVVDVLSDAAATINNTAVVSSDETDQGFDPDTTNNSVTEPTDTQARIDLAITKTDSDDPVTPGESFEYTLLASNLGPSDATQVSVLDNIPDGIQVTDVTSTVGTVNIPNSAQDTDPTNDEDITVDIGDLPQGDSVTIVIEATVLPATRGALSNEAEISTADSSAVETDTSNNSVTEPTALNPTIDLVVTKTDSIDPVLAGDSLTYEMVVTNNGPSTATEVDFSDTLPAGVLFVSATSTQGGAPTESNGTVTANLGTLEPSDNATVTIVVEVDPETRGTIANTATVSGEEDDSDTTNNTASASTDVNASVDVSVTKVSDTDPVAAGGSLTYTLEVTNTGPSTATGVTVADTLPTGLTFDSGSSTIGTVTNNGNDVTADIGTLAPDATAVITINASVAETATGSLSNTAIVNATESDSDQSNNTATDTTDVAVPGSIAGTVYLDINQSGDFDAGDTGIPNVTIQIVGTDILQNAIDQTITTDADGDYVFGDLLPGAYSLIQTQPPGFRDGQTNVGIGAGGVAGTNEITGLDLPSDTEATDYNFGELRSPLSKRRLLASTQPGD